MNAFKPTDRTAALWRAVRGKTNATVKLFVVESNGRPAGSGIAIALDGQDVGTTDRSGTITLTIPSGTREITAYVCSYIAGEITVTVSSGQSYEYYLYLDNRRPEREDSHLRIDELSWGSLSWNFDSFTMRFMSGRDTVRLRSITTIEAIDSRTGRIYELDNLFELSSSGAIRVRRPDRLSDTLRRLGGNYFELVVEAKDYSGYTHYDRVTIYLERSGLSL